MLKKNYYDECGGDCSSCQRFQKLTLGSVPVLTRKKVHKKFVPPDMTALKMLVDKNSKNYNLEEMSDKELKELEQELLGDILAKINKNG